MGNREKEIIFFYHKKSCILKKEESWDFYSLDPSFFIYATIISSKVFPILLLAAL